MYRTSLPYRTNDETLSFRFVCVLMDILCPGRETLTVTDNIHHSLKRDISLAVSEKGNKTSQRQKAPVFIRLNYFQSFIRVL